MKNLYFSLGAFFCFLTLQAQTNPTLEVGLETLTMNKGTIDVELLTKIIMEKQKELKGEAMKRFMLRLFPEENFTTKFYIQNCLHILLNEKNPKVIEKEILELTTNYALALGVTYALIKSNDDSVWKLNEAYLTYKTETTNSDNNNTAIEKPIQPNNLVNNIDKVKLIKQVRGKRFLGLYFQQNLIKKQYNLYKQQKALKDLLNPQNNTADFNNVRKNARKIQHKENMIRRKEMRIFEIKQRREITQNDEAFNLFTNISRDVYNYKNCRCYFRKFKFYIQENDLRINNQVIPLGNHLNISNTKQPTEIKNIKLNYSYTKSSEDKDKKYSIEDKDKKDYNSYKIKISSIASNIKKDRKKIDSLYNKLNNIKSESDFNKNKDEYKSDINALNNLLLSTLETETSASEYSVFKSQIQTIQEKINEDRTKRKELLLALKQDDIKIISEINPKLSVPFNRILDVVSLSLSEMDSLRKIGLFKTKIDYRTGDYYLKLGLADKGLKYQKDLQFFKDAVCNKISPYIEHYDVIKEFLKNNEAENIIDIKESLIKTSNEKVSSFLDINKLSFIEKLAAKEKIKDNILSIILLDIIKEDFAELSAPLTINDYKKIANYLSLIKDFKSKYTSIKSDINSELFKYEFTIIIEKKENINVDSENSNMQLIQAFNELPNGKIDEPKWYLFSSIPESYLAKAVEVSILKNNKVSSIEEFKQGVAGIKQYQDKKLPYDTMKDITLSDDFYTNLLKQVMFDIQNESLTFKENSTDTITAYKSARVIGEIYLKVKELSENKNVSLRDIAYFEENFLQQLIELKVRNCENEDFYSSLINYGYLLSPLLKIKVLKSIDNFENYDQQLLTLFEFISNLDKLDKAETFTSIVDMLRTGSDSVEDNLKEGEFKDGYLVFINAMKKYTIVNTNENYLEVDVASFLNDLQTYYGRNDNSRFSLYLSIGLNENIFIGNNFTFPDTGEKIKNIGFASEKLGLQYRLHSFRKYGDYKNIVKNDIYINDRAPFINDLYAIVYGSGLLYSLANTSTNENFDFAHLGLGVGVRFYNALDVNFIIGFPFVKDSHFGQHAFVGMGFDIPLGEYLERLGE